MAGRSRYRPPRIPSRRKQRRRRNLLIGSGAAVVLAGLLALALVLLNTTTTTSTAANVRYAKDLPPPAKLPKLKSGQHLPGYRAGGPTTSTSQGAGSTTGNSPSGSSSSTANSSAEAQANATAYAERLAQQGSEVTAVVRQYVQAVWCGPLSDGGLPRGNPVPPDPTQGLSAVARQWTGTQSLGPVKATLCRSGYGTSKWYLNGAPFGPHLGNNGMGSQPVAIELSYQTPSGAAYHVFFIENVLVRVTTTEKSVTGTQLEAMWVANDLAQSPEWIADPADFIIPPDAVVSSAISTRTALPTNTTHKVPRSDNGKRTLDVQPGS
jgi:hypothetical protein